MRKIIKKIRSKWRLFWDSVDSLVVEMENDWTQNI